MRPILLTLGWLVACGAPPCVELPESCDPLYEPTFDNVHAETLAPSCALSGCHDAGQAAAGMSFEDADEAYDHLVTDGRVDAGDPGCSVLMARVAGERSMPPGNPLSAAEQCAIQQWIEDGAAR